MWLLGYVRRMIDSWFVANEQDGFMDRNDLLFDVGAQDEHCMNVKSYGMCIEYSRLMAKSGDSSNMCHVI